MARTTAEIGRDATRLVEGTIETLAQSIGLEALPNELKTEEGIDNTFELLPRSEGDPNISYGIFYTQNKGSDSPVTILTKGEEKGMISFTLDKVAHIEYFCLLLDQPIVIMLCDLTTKTIYWLPIQLHTERYVQEMKRLMKALALKQRKSDQIQVYFDPAKCLLQNGVINEAHVAPFLEDIRLSKEYLVNRYKSKAKYYFRGTRPLHGMVIDQQNHIIEQLFRYFVFRFKELNFVPVEYLMHHYPIEPNEGATASHFDGFALKPGNKALWKVFEDVVFQQGDLQEGYPEDLNKVVDLEKKLKDITQQLHRLGIFYIEDNRARYVEVPLAETNASCSCSRCLFDQLKFAQARASMSVVPPDLEDKLKQAYVRYRFGHFIQAVELTEACAVIASDSRQYEWYFVSKYNLAKLGITIGHFTWGDPDLKKQSEELRATQPSEIVQHHPGTPNHEFLEALAADKIFSRISARLVTLNTKIREHYYSQLRGGTGSNSYVEELLCEFDQLKSLFQENYIVFEGFSDFGQVFEKVIEGTFASHAMATTQRSRMASFSPELVKDIIHYGEAEFMLKIFKRYELKALSYTAEADNPIHFGNLIHNFFQELREIPEELNFNTNLFFRQRCNKMFATLMTLAGILKLDPATEQRIYSELIPFLRSTVIDNHHFLQFVQYFIARNGKNLQPDTTKEFLRMSYETFEFYGSSFVETLASQLFVTKNTLTPEEFTHILQPVAAEVDDERLEEIYLSLVYLSKVCVPTAQTQIGQMISAQLTQRFSGQLYYMAMINDIIPYDDVQFSQFVEDCKLKENQISWSSIMGSSDKRFPHINAMINLAFKLGKNLSTPAFAEFKGIDPYYDWLIDMAGFDYAKFNPKWISGHDTIHYLSEIKKHSQILDHTVAYLKENPDHHLRDFFIRRLL
jgi:hypothetical protein